MLRMYLRAAGRKQKTWSDPKHKKNDQHGQKHPTNAQKAAKSEKKQPNKARSDLEFGRSWPPLSKEKQYITASMKCGRL